MAAPESFMLGDDEAAADAPAMPAESEVPDARTAAAKALMSALKSGNAAKFADAFEEMIMSIDTGDEEDMGAESNASLDASAEPMPPEMPF